MTATLSAAGVDEFTARRLTDRIRSAMSAVQEQLDELEQLIREARDGHVHAALGYKSWTAYVEHEFADLHRTWPKAERQQFVERLAALGMSTRAIAPVVGVNAATVSRDLAGVANATPATGSAVEELGAGFQPGEAIASRAHGDDSGTDSDQPLHLARANPEADVDEGTEPRPITGRDGKQYRASRGSARTAAARSGRVDVTREWGRVLHHVLEAVDASVLIRPEHLRNRKEEAARWARQLDESIQSLGRLADMLKENSQ